MIAIISENNEEYVSPVFAIKQAGWQSEVLAFNKERSHLRRIKIWHPRRRVFIVDREKFDCKKSTWEGYDWVLKDRKLWKAVRFGKKASTDDFPQFKQYAAEMVLPEWFEVIGGNIDKEAPLLYNFIELAEMSAGYVNDKERYMQCL